eukprot:TRINITY_DN3462_c0_g4_i1.p1 TRINITY_DN3462_c0_g4~~TRINITY_DN3462_c0_g4_i1.p1  ORF type:complete len:329 (+),score=59.10 TRINITY_DN3462_c0_g4_i1:157-1143(+)
MGMSSKQQHSAIITLSSLLFFYGLISVVVCSRSSASNSAFVPGTLLTALTYEHGSSVSQWDLTTGHNYSSPFLEGMMVSSTFLAPNDLYLVIYQNKSPFSSHSLYVYDYSSNTPTVRSSCTLQFADIFGCVVYDNDIIYIVTTGPYPQNNATLHIVDPYTCYYKSLATVPFSEETTDCIIYSDTLIYVDTPNLVFLDLPIRSVSQVVLPQSIRDYDNAWFDIQVDQNNGEVFLFASKDLVTTSSWTYQPSTKEFEVLCNPCSLNESVTDFTGLDTRFADEGILLTFLNFWNPLIFDLNGTVVWRGEPLVIENGPGWLYLDYDQDGKIF